MQVLQQVGEGGTIRFNSSLLWTLQKTNSGTLFWSGPKRCPHPLTFDVDNVSVLEILGGTDGTSGTPGILGVGLGCTGDTGRALGGYW